MPVDTSKSLAELTGKDWGKASPDTRELVRERLQLHRTPIDDLSDAEIAQLLNFAETVEILVPISLQRLRAEPDSMRLLCAVLRSESFPWLSHPEHVTTLRDIVDSAANQLSQITDDLDRASNEATMWRLYAGFERTLSKI